jgi:cytochrome c oxidase subunit II
VANPPDRRPTSSDAARGRPRGAITATLVACAVLAGCLPATPTAEGREVAWLYNVFLAAASVVFVVVVGLMAWAVLRYRGVPGRDVRLPARTHGHLGLEITWWAVPTALVALLVVLTATVLAGVDDRADAPEVTVNVEGFQWGWRFTYEDRGVEVLGTAEDPATIRLPVDQPIAFVITSNDVIHSFSIPSFLIKRDAVPGQENRFDVVIEDEGTYSGQCGEFCGLLHSYQLFSIEAVSPDEFEGWIDEEAARRE